MLLCMIPKHFSICQIGSWWEHASCHVCNYLLQLILVSLTFSLTCAVCSDVMKLGFSKPWPEALTMITGQPKMSAQPLMEYFQPLIEWLEKENNKNQEVRGWPDYDWKPVQTESTFNTFMHPHIMKHSVSTQRLIFFLLWCCLHWNHCSALLALLMRSCWKYVYRLDW